jgi:UPF0755 protein
MKTFLIIVGIIVILIAGALVGGYVYVNSVITSPQGTSDMPVSFVIQPGESSSEIAERLHDAGLLKNAEIFQFYLWKQGIVSKIKTGSFSITPALNMESIAEIITGVGKNPDDVSVTLIEGQWRAEIADQLVAKGLVTKADFLAATALASKYSERYTFLQGLPKDATLEGFLYPDTYIFSKKNTVDEIVSKILDNFQVRTKDLQGSSTNTGFTFYQTLTFASILQAEASKVSDLGLVAGVFENRMNAGMKFQSDATLHFILQDRSKKILISDTQLNSPYNLYQNAGLTPGPINSPGIDALKAALAPTKSNFFYFLATPEGEVIYSKTGAEHNAAKAKYLK